MELTHSNLFFQLIFYTVILNNVVFANSQEYRLPTKLRPNMYIIRLTIPSFHEETYSGSEVISFTTNETLDKILIHSSPEYVNITGAFLNGEHTDPCNWTYADPRTEILTISCNTTEVLSEDQFISISFTSTFSQDEYGFFKKNYEGIEDEEFVLLTRFSPTFARRVFPCFDEPEFKAIFNFFITHPATHQVLGSTPIINQLVSSNSIITEFDTSPLISTYSIGFLFSKFVPIVEEVTVGEFVYNIYTNPELKDYGKTAEGYGTDIVNVFGNWTGTKYHEMGSVQLHSAAVEGLRIGVVDNWGLLVGSEENLLDEGGNTTANQKQRIFSQLAKQIAHQWFGSYLSLGWWSHTWLNEGFARYFEHHVLSQVGVDYHLENQFVVDVLQETLYEDSILSMEELSSDDEVILTPSDVLRKFDKLMVNKGACIIRMMEMILGKNNFSDKMKAFITQHKFNSINPTLLLEALQLGNEIEPYLYRPGYPLVTVKLNDDHQSAIVTQVPFYLLKAEEVQNTYWNVPITYTTSLQKKFSNEEISWLKDNTTLTLSVPSEGWIILNNQQRGYYRVNYDETLWTRIIHVLNGNKRTDIDVLNRAQLINDIFAVARYGGVSYEKAFQLFNYIGHETDYYPWASALKVMKTLLNEIGDQETLVLLKRHILQWINTAFPNIQEINVSDVHMEIIKQNLILNWKCFLEDENCLSSAKNKFGEFKRSRTFQNYEERDIILCYGLKSSTAAVDDYSFVMKMYQDSKSPVEKEALLSALGCISDTDVITNYLTELILEGSVIPKYNALKVFEKVSSNGNGVDVALQFLVKYISTLSTTYKSLFPLSDFIVTLSGKISTWSQLHELKSLVDANEDLQDDASIRSLKIIENNLQWADLHTNTIKNILEHPISAGRTNYTKKWDLILLCIVGYLVAF